MRILLLGPSGQLGWELQRALAPLGELVGAGLDSPAPQTADLAQPESLPRLVRAVRPDVIVNAAAHTAVDQAEAEPARARTINAAAPGVLAREAAALGALMVHYGSDYVFDGSGAEPRDEAAPTSPLSVYGRTKLEGEQLVRASGCRHLILRTSWVHAARGGNFVRAMLKLAAERDALDVVDDQVGAPTGAELLADVTAHAIRALQSDPSRDGLYHCVAGGETSWYAYARFVIERARALGHPVRLAADAIRPVPTRDRPRPAARPLNSRLATHKLQRAFGLVLPPWQVGVERVLAEILDR
jgi:dTDP-4-dehydrorhamnose reductase